MIKEYKSFTEETLDDALTVIRDRFSPAAVEIARKVLRNPLRKLCPDAGTVGYRDGRPVCFQATMLRRLYYGKKEIFGQVGGLTCKVKKGCPLSVMLETIERAEKPRLDVTISFGNSCCASTANMDKCKGGVVGPESCSHSLWCPIRPLNCLWYVLRRKALKLDVPRWAPYDTRVTSRYEQTIEGLSIRRESVVSSSFFDTMMSQLLDQNEGLVCSRSAEEVDWMFGSRIMSGQAVLLCAYRAAVPAGYIIVGSDETARRWRILDWIAVRNDEGVLEALLKVAKRFLRQHTPGFMLEVRGFPAFAQTLLRRHLPFVQQRGVNFFTWSFLPERGSEVFRGSVYSTRSWFFGPYDGDLVM